MKQPAVVSHAFRGLTIGLVLLLSCTTAACAGQPEPGAAVNTADSAYVFGRADAAFELDGELKEISGLALVDGERAAAVQDENGYVYILRLSDGAIERRITFAKKGDYEGIEVVDGTIYVLESGGGLFQVTNWTAEEPSTRSIELDLPKNCDAEGLAYEQRGHRLLIACKENAGKGLSGSKAIYAYDLSTEQLQPDPAYVIDSDAVAESFRDHPVNEAVRSVLSDRFDLSGIKPSAAAVHPGTGQLFVVSSVRKVLLVLDTTGQVAHVWPLPEADFPQPEGLAFLPNGDLLISSEAGGGSHGTLRRFTYRAAFDGASE